MCEQWRGVCVCERDRGGERGCASNGEVCVCEREIEEEKENVRAVARCVCVIERDGGGDSILYGGGKAGGRVYARGQHV